MVSTSPAHLKLVRPPSEEDPLARAAREAQPSDGSLVLRARGGDRGAEEALYLRHGPRLLGMSTRLLRSKANAEDVVQDAFITGLRRLRSLRHPDSFASWITQITVRLIHRRWRRERLRRTLGFQDSADAIGNLAEIADPRAHSDIRLRLAELDDALGELDAADRMAWMLRRVEGRLLEEVAVMTDCSLATAKRRIGRADKRLREYVDQDLGGAHGE